MLDLIHKREERQSAIDYFKSHGVTDKEFLRLLREECYDDIAPAAPPEAVLAVLAMEVIPPRWAYLVLHFHQTLLSLDQIQQLINAVASSAEWSFKTLRYCFVTGYQAQQLINTVMTSVTWAEATLRHCLEVLTPNQVQQFVDLVSTDVVWSYYAVYHLAESLTIDQIQQFINRIATDPEWARETLRYCYKSLSPIQIQQLLNTVLPNCPVWLTADQVRELEIATNHVNHA